MWVPESSALPHSITALTRHIATRSTLKKKKKKKNQSKPDPIAPLAVCLFNSHRLIACTRKPSSPIPFKFNFDKAAGNKQIINYPISFNASEVEPFKHEQVAPSPTYPTSLSLHSSLTSLSEFSHYFLDLPPSIFLGYHISKQTSSTNPKMYIPRRKSPLGPGNQFSVKNALLYLEKSGRLPVVITAVFCVICVMAMYSEDIKALTSSSTLENSKSTGNAFSLQDISINTDNNPTSRTNLQSSIGSSEETQGFKRSPKKNKRTKKRPVPNGTVKSNPAVNILPAVNIPESCDLSKGEWVLDNSSYPIYREDQCEFLTEQVTCMRNGRSDDMYQKWKWQPKDCSLPRFNAKLFLERLRGKRLMFVGDSLNRNQWESMVCLVQMALSPGKKHWPHWEGPRQVFNAEEYNATVEFYWAPFIVESNSDNPKIHSIPNRIIKAESIMNHAVHWKDVDYLIFNSYIWWMNTMNMKVMRPKGQDWEEHDEVERRVAYGRVLQTWADWVNHNVDPKRTQVFFMSMSPLHISPQVWGNPDGIRCAKETTPVTNFPGPLYLGTDWEMFDIAANISRSIQQVPVTFVDATTMSEYRKDGHTSVYTIRQGKLLTPEQKADPLNFADCIHWCLPGVPDIWNLLLYARIMSRPAIQ